MAAPEIRSIAFVPARPEPPEDHAALEVRLEDGSFSSFVAATAEQPGRSLLEKDEDFSFGTPTLFVARLDEATVGEAVSAMAGNMGGYWLRYYNSLGELSSGARGLKLADGRRRKKARR